MQFESDCDESGGLVTTPHGNPSSDLAKAGCGLREIKKHAGASLVLDLDHNVCA